MRVVNVVIMMGKQNNGRDTQRGLFTMTTDGKWLRMEKSWWRG